MEKEMNIQNNKHRYVDYQIEEAYFDLLMQAESSEISITKIVQKAEVSRASFYRNYHDKEEILMNYLQNLVYEIQEIMTCKKDKKEICEDILSVIKDERERIVILSKQKYGMTLLHMINDLSLKYVEDHHINCTKNQIYANVGLAFNVIMQWVLDGCQADMCDVIDVILSVFI